MVVVKSEVNVIRFSRERKKKKIPNNATDFDKNFKVFPLFKTIRTVYRMIFFKRVSNQRCFSIYETILSDNRCKFLFENIRNNFVAQYNKLESGNKKYRKIIEIF